MSGYLRIVTILVLGCGMVVGATTVRADSEVEDARAKFQEAQKRFDEGAFTAAAALFRDAHELSPNWRLLYNIAQSEAAAMQYGMALETFERYLASGGDEIPRDRQDEVRLEITRLREMVGTLIVKTHRGADIFVNGTLRGTAPVHGGIPVAAGQQHRVEIRHEGQTLPEENVRVMGGQTVELTMQLDAVDADDDPERTTDGLSQMTDGRKLRVAGAVLMGIGGAGLATGAISGALAMSREKALDRNCDGTVCATKYEDVADARDRLAVTSTVMFGVGAAAVTAGVVLMVVGKRRNSEQLAMVPMVNRNVAGASLRWTF